MAQLFKCETVKQRKIMEWLQEQGVTAADIQSVQLVSRDLVRLTDPAGQHINVYCDSNNAVRILQVTAEQEEVLHDIWNDSSHMDDEEYREWYSDLADDEKALIDAWDDRYTRGMLRLCERILATEQGQAPRHDAPEFDM